MILAEKTEPLGTSGVWMIIGIVVLMLILSFLAFAEMGLSKMTRPKAAALLDKGHRAGSALQRLIANPERWVNAVLLSVNICQTAQAVLTSKVFGRLFGTKGEIFGLAINVIVFFVVAEALPKTWAVLYPERAALAAARPIDVLSRIPFLGWISKQLIRLTNVIVKGKGLDKGPFVSEQELLGIVETAAEEGVVEHEERQLIESIIEFGDTVAREVMVPRRDIVTAGAGESITTALDVAIEQGFSRVPVVGDDSDDDIVGLAYTKDLMKAERSGHGSELVGTVMRNVRFVPENKPLSQLMREMQAEKFHLAMVADEYGGIAGLVTLEDCLEELVGEIVDEYDDEVADIQRLDNGDYLVDGGTGISDVNDALEIEIPDEDWDTVGGFVFGTLGHVPEAGESVQFSGWRFVVVKMDNRRVRAVRVEVIADDEIDDATAVDAIDAAD